ncbi:hypothetical protein NMG60_11009539 [Bertholletia excelsa]
MTMTWRSHAGISCYCPNNVLGRPYSFPVSFFSRNISSQLTHFSSILHFDKCNPEPRLLGYLIDSRNDFSVDITHAKFIKNGSLQISRGGNHVLNLYTKSMRLAHAERVFDEIPQRDVHTWTVMISGFARKGSFRTAMDMFTEMLKSGVVPNQVTFSSILKCCSGLNELRRGKAIHGWIISHGIELDIPLANSILDLYVKCGISGYAEKLFQAMVEKDTVSWNIMISAYLGIGDMEKSMDLFRQLPLKDVATWNTIIDGHVRMGFERQALGLLYQMVAIGPSFNKFTFSIALVLVSSLSLVGLGRQIHGMVLRFGVHNDSYIRNSLIDMYCKCGEMEKALTVFQYLVRRTEESKIFYDKSIAGSVLWSSMITGYIQNGRLEDALRLFGTMIYEGIEMDKFTLTSIVSGCGNAGLLLLGQQIHSHILKVGHNTDVFLNSAMIHTYAKCGGLDDAWSIFKLSNARNIVLWTTMISSYASHGQGKKAIGLFDLMLSEGIMPNEVAFLGVLTACSHAGLLEEGCNYFNLMIDVYGIKASIEHFTCMIDLFGRAGRLNMIVDFIYKNEISHVGAVWKAFLSSCRIHKNVQMAKWVSQELLKLGDSEAGLYILLSNTCATSSRWEEVGKIRNLMKERGIKKQPGQSWLQLKDEVHVFVTGDRSHQRIAEIYAYLERLITRLKEIGYSKDVDMVMQDVEDEQKELILNFHSEKLAIAYGLLMTSSGMPIRVMKNLRICTDCHKFIKYTSNFLKREIIVRDIHRFHHFKHGECSCGDYW